MARTELINEGQRSLWRGCAIEIAAAGDAALAIGAAIKESVMNKPGSVTRP